MWVWGHILVWTHPGSFREKNQYDKITNNNINEKASSQNSSETLSPSATELAHWAITLKIQKQFYLQMIRSEQPDSPPERTRLNGLCLYQSISEQPLWESPPLKLSEEHRLFLKELPAAAVGQLLWALIGWSYSLQTCACWSNRNALSEREAADETQNFKLFHPIFSRILDCSFKRHSFFSLGEHIFSMVFFLRWKA